MVTTAKEVCGTAKVGCVKGDAWWNEDVRAVVQRKKEAYLGMLQGRVSQDEYRITKLNAAKIVRESKAKCERDRVDKLQHL